MTNASQNPPASTPQRSADQQKLLLELVTTLFERKITFNEFLGFKIDSIDKEPVRISFVMRPELVGHFLYGRLHGGVISSVLDVVGGLSIMMGITRFYGSEDAEQVIQRFAQLATIDLRVDYLRPGIGEVFFAEAELVRLGKRVGVCSMRLSNDSDVLLATGNASYIVS
ncbi:MAG: thioesterase family protein [Granulosicoccus sp.]